MSTSKSSGKGSKAKYTSKQKRQAQHIEKSAKESGKSTTTAKRMAWATVNKETGGAGKAVRNTAPSKKGGRLGGKVSRRSESKKAA